MPRKAAIAALLLAAPLAGCGAEPAPTAAPLPSAPVTVSSPSTASTASAPTISPTTTPSTTHDPLAVLRGKVIGIDPGHNGGNKDAPAIINKQVWNGRGYSPCNTTGTATNDGYPEADFNWAVAQDLAADLRKEGAKVVMTRTSNTGVGPCIQKRAAIINDAKADIAIDIHADGAPAGDRGFSLLLPVRTNVNKAVVADSRRYAGLLRQEMKRTGMPVASYLGRNGFVPRDDLAGLNLTTVPQVLMEAGNMRNAQDARMHRSPTFQRATAAAIARAMAAYLSS